LNNEHNALAAMDELPVPKAVFKNIIPSIATLLMMIIYNMADMAFIGLTHDDYQIAAVTLATPIFMLFMSLERCSASAAHLLYHGWRDADRKKRGRMFHRSAFGDVSPSGSS
jgi:hypothetical protein